MAEISQTSTATTETADTPSTIRKTEPGKKRLLLTLAVLFSFVLGFPFLLNSTKIHRSPLPHAAIDVLSNRLQATPLSFPFRFQVVFIGFDEMFDESSSRSLELSISDQMRERTGIDPDFTVSVVIDSGENCVRSQKADHSCLWRCGLVDFLKFDQILSNDEAIDELLNGALHCLGSGEKVYTAVAVNRDAEEGVRVVVGKYRHFWISGRVAEADAVSSMMARLFVDVFMNGVMVKGKGEFMPVGADGSVVLSFNLLNSDPNDWVYDWDFNKIAEMYLAPVVKAIAPIADISVESQVLYHTPKSSFSYWDEELASHIFSTNDLPFFVNSYEWHLDTSIAAAGRSKVLQFVAYVPSAKECPLFLQLSNGRISTTNGFISPMWGGVTVWNPPSCLRTSNSVHPVRNAVVPEDLWKIFQVFIGQLRLLFGLKSSTLNAAEFGISNFLASERGFAEWELDALFRHHTNFNLLSCVSTLGSLSRLVQSLPRMIVIDEIGKQVKFSLEAASRAESNASRGLYEASAVSSRQARALAEDAFFHPSIMSLSYSSSEHYFAIYMPFFAPVSLHVLLAAIKEVKRYKQERKKYMAWLNQRNPN